MTFYVSLSPLCSGRDSNGVRLSKPSPVLLCCCSLTRGERSASFNDSHVPSLRITLRRRPTFALYYQGKRKAWMPNEAPLQQEHFPANVILVETNPRPKCYYTLGAGGSSSPLLGMCPPHYCGGPLPTASMRGHVYPYLRLFRVHTMPCLRVFYEQKRCKYGFSC